MQVQACLVPCDGWHLRSVQTQKTDVPYSTTECKLEFLMHLYNNITPHCYKLRSEGTLFRESNQSNTPKIQIISL
jgi:hypothetical protein